MSIDVQLKGMVNRELPDPDLEHFESAIRLGRYDETYVYPIIQTMHGLSDEGTYFTTAGNNPVGTGIAFTVNAAVSETAGYFISIFNKDPASNYSNAKRLYLDYIKLIPSTVPASATAGHMFLKMSRTNRYSSGGTLLTPANNNMDSPRASIAQIYNGALTTAAAASTDVQVGRGVIRSQIPVVNDVYILKSGSVETNRNSGGISSTTAVGQTIPVGPIVIGPSAWLGLQLWFPGNLTTAGVFETEIGWWER